MKRSGSGRWAMPGVAVSRGIAQDPRLGGANRYTSCPPSMVLDFLTCTRFRQPRRACGTTSMDVSSMAPKTRHLSQGKRKRPNRRSQGNVAPQPTPVRDTGAGEPRSNGSVADEARSADASPAEHPVNGDRVSSAVAPRRPATGRRMRPYVATNRPRARATSDAPRSTTLPREMEYAFIRADMRRLLFTAGSLAIVMIVLLLVLER